MKKLLSIILCLFIGGSALIQPYVFAQEMEFRYWSYVPVDNWTTKDKNSDDEICDVCGSPPAEFGLYQDFVYEVLSKIKLFGTKGKYTWKPVPARWFQGEVFNIPDENQNILANLTKQIGRNLKQKMGTMTATMAILLSVSKEIISKDGIGWFLILWKEMPFVTARGVLLKIDAAVHDKIFDLGLSANWNEKVTAKNIQEIQDVFTKYTLDSYRLFEIAELEKWVKYRHITALLLRINSAMKTFIMSSGITTFQFKNNQFSKWAWDPVKLMFEFKNIASMKWQYACARGVKMACNSSMKKFAENMKKLWKDSIKWAKTAFKTIKDASVKFKNAFSLSSTRSQRKECRSIEEYTRKECLESQLTDEQKKYIQEQSDLLGTLYWVDKDKMFEGAALNRTRSLIFEKEYGVKEFMEAKMSKEKLEEKERKKADKAKKDQAKKMKQEKKDFLKAQWKMIFVECLDSNKEHYRKVNEFINNSDPELRDSITSCTQVISILNFVLAGEVPSRSQLIEALEQSASEYNPLNLEWIIGSVVNRVLKLQELDTKRAFMASNRDVTLFFIEVFNQVFAVEQIIWNKDTDGIVSQLGRACEAQCQNKWGKCRY